MWRGPWGVWREAKERLKAGYEVDAQKLLETLAERQPGAFDIYCKRHLSRDITKLAFRQLSYSRGCQVTLGSIECTPPFKVV